LSSGEWVRLWSFFVEPLVAEHGPKDVNAAAGQGEHGLGVAFALGSFAVDRRPEKPGCVGC
jgi:hypothetical protein